MNDQSLTNREREVVRLAAANKPQKVIARELCISRSTVAEHLRNARKKPGMQSTLEMCVKFVGGERQDDI